MVRHFPVLHFPDPVIFSSPAFSRPCDSLRSCPSFSSPAFSGRTFSVAPARHPSRLSRVDSSVSDHELLLRSQLFNSRAPYTLKSIFCFFWTFPLRRCPMSIATPSKQPHTVPNLFNIYPARWRRGLFAPKAELQHTLPS